ncbi:hypothetical protein BC940DRAFT_288106 [Gongronella butleri]|nr:hypothetical protein BC940DRAFT_288106 [Gongronella butleri]
MYELLHANVGVTDALENKEIGNALTTHKKQPIFFFDFIVLVFTQFLLIFLSFVFAMAHQDLPFEIVLQVIGHLSKGDQKHLLRRPPNRQWFEAAAAAVYLEFKFFDIKKVLGLHNVLCNGGGRSYAMATHAMATRSMAARAVTTRVTVPRCLVYGESIRTLDLSCVSTRIPVETLRPLVEACVRLTSLNVAHCINLKNADLISILSNVPQLQRLSVAGCVYLTARALFERRPNGQSIAHALRVLNVCEAPRFFMDVPFQPNRDAVLPNLESITVGYCVTTGIPMDWLPHNCHHTYPPFARVSENNIRSFFHHCPSLRTLTSYFTGAALIKAILATCGDEMTSLSLYNTHGSLVDVFDQMAKLTRPLKHLKIKTMQRDGCQFVEQNLCGTSTGLNAYNVPTLYENLKFDRPFCIDLRLPVDLVTPLAYKWLTHLRTMHPLDPAQLTTLKACKMVEFHLCCQEPYHLQDLVPTTLTHLTLPSKPSGTDLLSRQEYAHRLQFLEIGADVNTSFLLRFQLALPALQFLCVGRIERDCHPIIRHRIAVHLNENTALRGFNARGRMNVWWRSCKLVKAYNLLLHPSLAQDTI